MSLEGILLDKGGKGLEPEPTHPNFKDPRVTDYLRQHGRLFDKTGLEIRKLANRGCHNNVSDSSLIILEGYRIAHGYALGTDGLWYCHSWGFLDRHIIQTCP